MTKDVIVDDPCEYERSTGSTCGSKKVKVSDNGHAWCATCGTKREVPDE